nr:hypothetical protein [Sphaerisporangium perillae]
MTAGLGDGNAMQGGVELPISAAVESVTIVVAAPHGDRGGAVVPGKCCGAVEAGDVADLAQEFRGGEHVHPDDRQQARDPGLDQRLELLFDGVDFDAEGVDEGDLSQCHPFGGAGTCQFDQGS